MRADLPLWRSFVLVPALIGSGGALCIACIAGGLCRQASTKKKDAPSEAVDPVPLSLSGPLHNRRMGGVEAGRRRARFHRGRRAGREGVQILPRRSIEKGTSGSLLLSQIIHERLHGRGARIRRKHREFRGGRRKRHWSFG